MIASDNIILAIITVDYCAVYCSL